MKSPWAASAPTLIHAYDDSPASYGVWQFGASSSVRSAATRYAFGNGALRVEHTLTASPTNATRIHFDEALDFTGTGQDSDLIHLAVSFEGGTFGVDRGQGASFRIQFTDGGWSNYCDSTAYIMGNTKAWRPNHYILSLRKSDFTGSGSWASTIAWDSINRVAVLIRNAFDLDAGAGFDFGCDVNLDALLFGGSASKVPVTLSFDDNDEAQYDEIAGKLEAYGWSMSLGVVKNTLGNTNAMTEAESLELHNKGHRWIDHTGDHVDVDAGDAAHEADILECHDYVNNTIANPLPFHIHTSGKYNQNSVDYLQSLGKVDARSVWSLGNTSGSAARLPSCLFDLAHMPMQFEHPTFNFDSTSAVFGTAALMNAEIDRCVDRACGVHLYGHYISTNPGTIPAGSNASRGYVTAQFDLVLAHLADLESQGKIEVMPWHAWAMKMHGLGRRRDYIAVTRRTADQMRPKQRMMKPRRGGLRDL